jgi:hypothetical protein
VSITANNVAVSSFQIIEFTPCTKEILFQNKKKNISFNFQNGISNLISAKVANISRFKGIKQMWVGADYSPTKKWQWRGFFKDFTGCNCKKLKIQNFKIWTVQYFRNYF